jgi:hypothetical protein
VLKPIACALAPLTVLGALAACATMPAAEDEGCDRDCLAGLTDGYLASLLSHDPNALPLAENVRFTEDGVDHAPGEGFWATATALEDLRLSVLDPELGAAVGLAVMAEGEQIVLHAFRLKVEGALITEVETLVVKPRGENPFVNRETLARPRTEFLVSAPPELMESREEIARIAQFYPDGLKAGSFVEVDAPFSAGARRLENGMILAGPDCTFNPNCGNMKTQPSPTRPTLRQRSLAIDEETGVAFFWLTWRQASGNWIAVWEAFKVYDGQIWAVEAFLENMDPTIGSGWGEPPG